MLAGELVQRRRFAQIGRAVTFAAGLQQIGKPQIEQKMSLCGVAD